MPAHHRIVGVLQAEKTQQRRPLSIRQMVNGEIRPLVDNSSKYNNRGNQFAPPGSIGIFVVSLVVEPN